MKTSIAALVALVFALAFFRVIDTKNIEQEIKNNPQLAPHVVWRVQLPPVQGDDLRRESEFLKQVAVEVDKSLPLQCVGRKMYHPYKGLN